MPPTSSRLTNSGTGVALAISHWRRVALWSAVAQRGTSGDTAFTPAVPCGQSPHRIGSKSGVSAPSVLRPRTPKRCAPPALQSKWHPASRLLNDIGGYHIGQSPDCVRTDDLVRISPSTGLLPACRRAFTFGNRCHQDPPQRDEIVTAHRSRRRITAVKTGTSQAMTATRSQHI